MIVDSLGVVGRRLGSLRSWDWSIIGEQLATRDPRLVVLQYGTNEADDPDLDLEALAKYYDETILRIRAAAPTASILILGPPDMGVREGGKRVRSHEAAEARRRARVIPECEWRTPDVLREIIAVEHAAAVRNQVAFFDTFAAMGGADQMDGGSSPSRSSPTRITSTSPTSATSGGPMRCRARCSPSTRAGGRRPAAAEQPHRCRGPIDAPLPADRPDMLFSSPDYPLFLIAVFFLYALARWGGRAAGVGARSR